MLDSLLDTMDLALHDEWFALQRVCSDAHAHTCQGKQWMRLAVVLAGSGGPIGMAKACALWLCQG